MCGNAQPGSRPSLLLSQAEYLQPWGILVINAPQNPCEPVRGTAESREQLCHLLIPPAPLPAPSIPPSLPHPATWKIAAKNEGTPRWDVMPQEMPEKPCTLPHMLPHLPSGPGMRSQFRCRQRALWGKEQSKAAKAAPDKTSPLC